MCIILRNFATMKKTMMDVVLMKAAKILSAVVLLAVMFLSHSCGSKNVGDLKLCVVVDIMPVYDLVNSIAGDSISVECLLPRGGNPETYEPTMSQIAKVESSDAFMYVNNIGFEMAIINRIKSNGSGSLLVNLSDSIDLLYGTHGDCRHHHHHGETCNHSADADPHVWSSAKNARIISSEILGVLKRLDPENAGYYETNYNKLVTRIDSIDAHLDSLLTPHKGKAFAVWHPSLGYFARDYGLEQISLGGLENKETSVKQLRDKIETALGQDVGVFVVQLNYDDRQSDVVNKQLGAQVVEIDPLSARWEEQLIKVADAIAAK